MSFLPNEPKRNTTNVFTHTHIVASLDFIGMKKKLRVFVILEESGCSRTIQDDEESQEGVVIMMTVAPPP